MNNKIFEFLAKAWNMPNATEDEVRAEAKKRFNNKPGIALFQKLLKKKEK